MKAETIRKGSSLLESISNTKGRIKVLNGMGGDEKRGLTLSDGTRSIYFYGTATPNMIKEMIEFALEKLINHQKYLEGQLKALK
jgi:hypothetical protein